MSSDKQEGVPWWCVDCTKPIQNIDELCKWRRETIIRGRHIEMSLEVLHWECLMKRKTLIPS